MSKKTYEVTVTGYNPFIQIYQITAKNKLKAKEIAEQKFILEGNNYMVVDIATVAEQKPKEGKCEGKSCT